MTIIIQSPRMFFKNPTFNPGRNLTVRRGTKWDGQDMQRGVCLMDDVNEMQGIVDTETRVMRFVDLVNSDLIYEHDPECRTVSGLLRVMLDLYPNFDEREMVTLVSFNY